MNVGRTMTAVLYRGDPWDGGEQLVGTKQPIRVVYETPERGKGMTARGRLLVNLPITQLRNLDRMYWRSVPVEGITHLVLLGPTNEPEFWWRLNQTTMMGDSILVPERTLLMEMR